MPCVDRKPRWHKHFNGHQRECIVGICPKCGKPTLWDERNGPVWTCPYNLSKSNPYWEPRPDGIEADGEKNGIYSNCFEDTGGGFCESIHMPLHSKCYERGNY